MFYTEKSYPYRLKDAAIILQCCVLLTEKQNLNNQSVIGAVGTRNCLPNGKDIHGRKLNSGPVAEIAKRLVGKRFGFSGGGYMCPAGRRLTATAAGRNPVGVSGARSGSDISGGASCHRCEMVPTRRICLPNTPRWKCPDRQKIRVNTQFAGAVRADCSRICNRGALITTRLSPMATTEMAHGGVGDGRRGVTKLVGRRNVIGH